MVYLVRTYATIHKDFTRASEGYRNLALFIAENAPREAIVFGVLQMALNVIITQLSRAQDYDTAVALIHLFPDVDTGNDLLWTVDYHHNLNKR